MFFVCTERVTSLLYACVQYIKGQSAYMNSCCINSIVIHIIQVDGKHSSVPVKEATVTLQFDPENMENQILSI